MKSNTINIKEIQKFSKMADEWWDPNGKFKPLHKFNPVRIHYIKNNYNKIQEDIKNNDLPSKKDFLKKFEASILDIS